MADQVSGREQRCRWCMIFPSWSLLVLGIVVCQLLLWCAVEWCSRKPSWWWTVVWCLSSCYIQTDYICLGVLWMYPSCKCRVSLHCPRRPEWCVEEAVGASCSSASVSLHTHIYNYELHNIQMCGPFMTRQQDNNKITRQAQPQAATERQ